MERTPAPPLDQFRPAEWAEAKALYEQVEEEPALPLHVTGEDALFAVVCALTQRLSGGEAAELVAALPRPVRPLFEACPRRWRERPEEFEVEEFFERVAARLKVTDTDAEAISRAVFVGIQRWLSPEELRHTASQLPERLRKLWSAPTAAPAATSHSPPSGPPSGPLSASAMPPQALTAKVLAEVKRSWALPPGVTEHQAVAAVLCTLSQRLSRGEAAHLVAALPPGLQPLVERCALHRGETAQLFDRQEFLQRVARHLHRKPEQSEAVTRAVFAAIERALAPENLRHVASQLPADLRHWWAAETPAPAP